MSLFESQQEVQSLIVLIRKEYKKNYQMKTLTLVNQGDGNRPHPFFT